MNTATDADELSVPRRGDEGRPDNQSCRAPAVHSLCSTRRTSTARSRQPRYRPPVRQPAAAAQFVLPSRLLPAIPRAARRTAYQPAAARDSRSTAARRGRPSCVRVCMYVRACSVFSACAQVQTYLDQHDCSLLLLFLRSYNILLLLTDSDDETSALAFFKQAAAFSPGRDY